MKKRISRIVNFVAFNLLFFSLYLNFIHKDANPMATVTAPAPAATASVTHTVLVENPEQYLKKETQNLKQEAPVTKASFN